MGMFDSLYIQCPNCKKRLEFQSKSGRRCMDEYNKNNLPPEVAIGMDKNIVRCEFCNKNFMLVCDIPLKVKVKLIQTNKKKHYRGNYNPNSRENKESLKELDKLIKGN